MQTILSEHRQVNIPKAICEAYHLSIGQTLEIEITTEGILLKVKSDSPNKITLDEVAGCLAYQGETKTLEDMEQAIAQGITSQWGKNDSR